MLIQLPIMIGLYQAIMYCVPATPLQLFQFSHHIYKWLPGIVGLVPLQSTFLGMDLGQPPGMPRGGDTLCRPWSLPRPGYSRNSSPRLPPVMTNHRPG